MLAVKSNLFMMNEKCVNMIKNYFLYSKPPYTIIPDSHIYSFPNARLIALDTEFYNSKTKRLSIKRKYGLTTFSVCTELYMHIIHAMLKDTRFKITDLKFNEQEFDYEDELISELSLGIVEVDRFQYLLELITADLNIGITELTFYFNSTLYHITYEGIINTDTSDEKFQKFVNDQYISSLLMGYHR